MYGDEATCARRRDVYAHMHVFRRLGHLGHLCRLGQMYWRLGHHRLGRLGRLGHLRPCLGHALSQFIVFLGQCCATLRRGPFRVGQFRRVL